MDCKGVLADIAADAAWHVVVVGAIAAVVIVVVVGIDLDATVVVVVVVAIDFVVAVVVVVVVVAIDVDTAAAVVDVADIYACSSRRTISSSSKGRRGSYSG